MTVRQAIERATTESRLRPIAVKTQRQRTAVVYVRQSSPTQLERNPESTTRQYQLVARAHALGWLPPQVQVTADMALGAPPELAADVLITLVERGHIANPKQKRQA